MNVDEEKTQRLFNELGGEVVKIQQRATKLEKALRDIDGVVKKLSTYKKCCYCSNCVIRRIAKTALDGKGEG